MRKYQSIKLPNKSECTVFEGKCLWPLSCVSDREQALCMCSPVLLVYAWCAALNILNVHFFQKPVWISSARWCSVIPSGVLFSLSFFLPLVWDELLSRVVGVNVVGLVLFPQPALWMAGEWQVPQAPKYQPLWVCNGNCAFLQGRTQSINQQMFCRGKSNTLSCFS